MNAKSFPEKSGRSPEVSADDRLRRLSAWSRRRGSGLATGAPPVEVSLDVQLRRWQGLSLSVVTFVLEAAAVPGGAAGVRVIAALFGMEGAQSALLQSIERKVTLLVEGPFHVGRLRLQEARRVSSTHADYVEHVRYACDRFYDAHAQATSIQHRALVEMHLGVVNMLLGKKSDAVHWFGEAYGSAREALRHLAESSADTRFTLPGRWGANVTSYLQDRSGAEWVVKLPRARGTLAAAHTMIPFVNCLAECFNALSADSGRATLPRVRLVEEGDFIVVVNQD